ncbi:MAG: NAD(P)-dependent oxidoreductase [Peptococcaceae bacterium]|nr:NAD(P)-dependent oxidoreductase [Peptococcaceae bacterium]
MNIAFIGLGNMGSLMAANLINKGFPVAAYDLLSSPLKKIAVLGARKGTSSADAARGAQLVITMLPQSTDTEEVLFGKQGAAAVLGAGAIVIDMGTGSPSMIKAMAGRLKEKGVDLLDAPVSGGVGKAKTGKLSIMAAGEEKSYQKALPVLEAMGEEVFYVGASGNGQTIKLINNMLTGINLAGICEGMVMGMKAGIEPRLLLEIINSSSGESYSSKVKIPNFVFKRDFNGGFKTKLQHKDMNLATNLARELKVPAVLGNLAREYYLAAMAKGKGEEDASVIITLLEEVAGTEVKI